MNDVYLRELDKIKAMITTKSRNWLIAFGLAVILLIILLVVVFRKNKENASLTMLKEQQQKLDELTKQQKQIAEQDRLRDSIYWDTYLKNTKAREGQLSTEKKKTNEIINRINQPDFNADSIKKWWANN